MISPRTWIVVVLFLFAGALGSAAPTRAEACIPSGSNHCLNASRFRVDVDWTRAGGESGRATTVPFASADSGLFWFFSEDNWELLVKVVDGCAVNGNYWVFAAATTDLGFELRVVDTETGAEKSYRNPVGRAAESVVDIDAFPVCSDAARAGAVASPSARPLLRSAEALERVANPVGGCFPSSGNLCLGSGRFEVTADWKGQDGSSGQARRVPFGSRDTGLLWFFDENNWELVVKVLDACALNDRFWVFAAATTNVEYTLTVRDTVSGETWSTFNPLGRKAPAVTDTDALDVCGAQPAALPRIEVVTDASIVLDGAGAEATVELEVFDGTGEPVASPPIDWSSSDPGLVSVTPGEDAAATVEALAAGPGSATVTASYGGSAVELVAVVAPARASTAVLPASSVLSREGAELRLEKTPQTLAIETGDVVFSGDAGVLDRVTGVDASGSEIVLQTEEASLPEAFEEIAIDYAGQELQLRIELAADREGSSTLLDGNGRVLERHAVAATGDFECRNESGVSGVAILRGAEIVADLRFKLPFVYRWRDRPDDLLRLAVRGEYDATLKAGVLDLRSNGNLKIVCDRELAQFRPARVPASLGFFLALGVTPVVGVEARATIDGPGLKLTGPAGSALGTLEAGIQYTPQDGFEPVGGLDSFDGPYTPPSAVLNVAGFTFLASAFARVDFGVLTDFGVPPLGVSLADIRLADVKVAATAQYTQSLPFERTKPGYLGPTWKVSGDVFATLKTRIGGPFGTLLKRLGLPTAFPGQLDLIKKSTALLASPTVSLRGAPLPGEPGDQVVFEVSSSKDTGDYEIWRYDAGSSQSDLIATGSLDQGFATAMWTVDEDADHRYYATLTTDETSRVTPYASGPATLLGDELLVDFESPVLSALTTPAEGFVDPATGVRFEQLFLPLSVDRFCGGSASGCPNWNYLAAASFLALIRNDTTFGIDFCTLPAGGQRIGLMIRGDTPMPPEIYGGEEGDVFNETFAGPIPAAYGGLRISFPEPLPAGTTISIDYVIGAVNPLLTPVLRAFSPTGALVKSAPAGPPVSVPRCDGRTGGNGRGTATLVTESPVLSLDIGGASGAPSPPYQFDDLRWILPSDE